MLIFLCLILAIGASARLTNAIYRFNLSKLLWASVELISLAYLFRYYL